MIELPESYVLSGQIKEAVSGKTVQSVEAGKTPHKFAWFYGDEATYDEMLRGKTVTGVSYHGGHVEVDMDEMRFDFHDGVNLTFLTPEANRPPKHQILIEFTDGSALVGSVQMYGGIYVFPEGENDNPYYLVGKQKPDPLGGAFDPEYFESLLRAIERKSTSAKAFLATEQRIPGVGNGVTQDILWKAGVHPKVKMAALHDAEVIKLFDTLKAELTRMAENGGRDTEKDLYGNFGGYRTVMSRNNKAMICPRCGGGIKKEIYMGGSVYYCPVCQSLK